MSNDNPLHYISQYLFMERACPWFAGSRQIKCNMDIERRQQETINRLQEMVGRKRTYGPLKGERSQELPGGFQHQNASIANIIICVDDYQHTNSMVSSFIVKRYPARRLGFYNHDCPTGFSWGKSFRLHQVHQRLCEVGIYLLCILIAGIDRYWFINIGQPWSVS